MSAIKLENDRRKYPQGIQQHIAKRLLERTFLPSMQIEFNLFFKTANIVPDLVEAPAGWYKKCQGFTIFGEGGFVKTVSTIYHPIQPRPHAVDWDKWVKAHPKTASLDILLAVAALENPPILPGTEASGVGIQGLV